MRAFLAFLLLAVQEAPGAFTLTEAEFARRRTALAERLPDGVLALDAGPLGEVGSDANTPIFDFKYLTGFHDTEGVLFLVDGKLTVFAGDLAKAPVGTQPLDKLEAWVADALAGRAKVYTKLRRKNLDALAKAAPKAEVVSGKLSAELARLRVLKGELELGLIRKASDATCKAHVAALKAVKPGVNERAIQELVESTFKKERCPELGFPSICASGRNGTVLHYMKNNQEIPKDTLMVIDIGAAIQNYVTDITRTLPTSGKFSAGQRKHYQCVLDAQKAAEAILKPGATFSDLERAARKVFEERELTQWSYAHSKEGSVRHGLGHFVGMAVHDSGNYRDALQAGMVITIEPGWYDKDAGYGIRIEDIYLVTADGCERLSATAPREIDEIEKAMAPKRDY